MTGTMLALASAASYGISDFVGGVLARRASFVSVALVGQVGGLLTAAVVAPLADPAVPTAADLGWGALSGLGTGVGMLLLFRGLGRGSMAVVVPVSAVTGIALPVLVGVVAFAERPTVWSWLGIVGAVPALWMVSRSRRGSMAASATFDGLLAGVGIALQYLALAQVPAEAGIWPIVAGRVAALVTILPVRGRERMSWRTSGAAAAAGAMAALALVCYLMATGRELVTVAVVLSSLYPVVPVLLAITVLGERLTWRQATGLVLAAAAIALLAHP